MGFADLDRQIGFGYVMNQYQAETENHPDLRWSSLVDALYASLGEPVIPSFGNKA